MNTQRKKIVKLNLVTVSILFIAVGMAVYFTLILPKPVLGSLSWPLAKPVVPVLNDWNIDSPLPGYNVIYCPSPPKGDCRGTADNDWIVGTNNNDRIYAGSGDDFVWGKAGDDKIYLGSGDDVGIGGEGNDEISGGAGNDILIGGNLIVSEGTGSLTGVVIALDWAESFSGNDRLNGEQGNDNLQGQDGNDVIYGKKGNDLLIAGSGNDYDVSGGDGDDFIDGGPGDDRVDGRSGSDTVLGGEGNDAVYDYGSIFEGNCVNGGPGYDTYVKAEGVGNNLIISGEDGAKAVYSGNGSDILNIFNGAADSDVSARLGNDTVYRDIGLDVKIRGAEVILDGPAPIEFTSCPAEGIEEEIMTL